jgi:hypothetical protein
MSTAANVSNVGSPPAQAINTSGASPSWLPAQPQMPRPALQWRTAAFMFSHCGASALPGTMTLT